MIVTADEVHRSLKGALDLLNRQVDGLKAFDLSERGFWRSFAAISLTIPAYVVSVAFERSRLGLASPEQGMFDSLWLDLALAFGHVASFAALPLAMIWITRRLRLTDRYVPFVIVTNWITALGLIVLSVPAILMLVGWAPPPLASLFTLCFGIVILRLQWFATKVTLGVSGGLALTIVAVGIGLNYGIATVTQALVA
jgi:hypothetical protein